ncbi:MAG: hypothetical protein AAF431_17340 [Pseudomonadota bacterium]
MLKQPLRMYPYSRAVRNGRCGTCPKTLTSFIDLCHETGLMMPREERRKLHLEVIEIIQETICDPLIAKCWRGWCLDNLDKPLAYVRQNSVTDQEKNQLAKLEAELRILSAYFVG